MHQRGGIELAVFESLRKVLIEALSFGFGVAKLVLVRLLTVGIFLVHTVPYVAFKQAHNQATK